MRQWAVWLRLAMGLVLAWAVAAAHPESGLPPFEPLGLYTNIEAADRVSSRDNVRDVVSERGLWMDVNGNGRIETIDQFPFQPADALSFFGNVEHPVWLRLDLRPTARRMWWLVLQPTMLYEATVYVPLADGGWHEVRVGLGEAVVDRPVPSLNYIVPLHLEPEQANTVYVRLRTANPAVMAQVLTPSAAFTQDRLTETLLTLYLGVSLTMALICTVAWQSTRDSFWLTSALFDFVTLAATITFTGLASRWFTPTAQGLWTQVHPYMACLHLAAGGLYYLRLLQMFDSPRWATVPFQLAVAIGLALMAALAVGVPPAPVLRSVSLLVLPIAVAALIVPMRLQSKDRLLLITVRAFLFLIGTYLLFWASPWVVSLIEPTWLNLFPTFPSNLVTMLISAFIGTRHSLERARVHRDAAQAQWDATRRLEIEQARHEATAAFLAMVTHEIRNPLAIVRQVAANLMRQDRPADTARSLRLIDAAASDVSAILDRCSEVHRLESGALMVRLAPLDVDAALAPWIHAHPQAQRLRWTIQPPLPCAEVDVELLQRMVRNLVENALKYSPTDSTVTISAEANASHLKLVVRNAIGRYGAPDPARVFSKYYRSDRAQSVSGTGLGLYWVSRVAHLMGGSVAFETLAGEVRFRLTVPLHPPATQRTV